MDDSSGDSELVIKSRHLPHWSKPDSIYFLTSRVAGNALSTDEQRIVYNHIKGGSGEYYDLIAMTILPDHFHIIFQPKDSYTLSRIMKGIKGVTARLINQARNQTGVIWQHESFDRIIRNNGELNEKLNYMLSNSVRLGLTENPWEYTFWYLNEEFGNQSLSQ